MQTTSVIGRPASGASAIRRSYRLCTDAETTPQPGHTAAVALSRAWAVTPVPSASNLSITRSAKWGNNISRFSDSHTCHNDAPSPTVTGSRFPCQNPET